MVFRNSDDLSPFVPDLHQRQGILGNIILVVFRSREEMVIPTLNVVIRGRGTSSDVRVSRH